MHHSVSHDAHAASLSLSSVRWWANSPEGGRVEQTIFMICLFFGVASVVLIAFTLLWIALGKLDV